MKKKKNSKDSPIFRPKANERKSQHERQNNSYLHYEDLAMKTAIQFFGEEILPFLGIEGIIEMATPTESVYLEMKQMYQDYNYTMKDSKLAHFEFQSQDNGIPDLKRFRMYEGFLSVQYDMPVITYVVYSGNVKNPITSFKEGVNTYKIVPILLNDRNADKIIKESLAKINAGNPLSKEELLTLSLTPLMGGDLTQMERIESSFRILQNPEGVAETIQDEMHKLQAILYAFANKFLKEEELTKLKEVISMTLLGQLIKEEGKAEGIAEGIEVGKAEGIEVGKAEGLIEGIFDLLGELGEIPIELKKKISEENNTENLVRLLRYAAKSNTIDDFLIEFYK